MHTTSIDTPLPIGVAKKPFSFTVALQARSGGLTDQLYQFSTFFKLGLLLGLRYCHTPLVSERTSTDYNPHDFLGINSFFRDSAPAPNTRFVDVRFDGKHLENSGVSCLEGLLEYARNEIDRALQDDAVRQCQKDPGDASPPVFRFSLVMGNGRGFFDYVHSTYPLWPPEIDLLSHYRFLRRSDPRRSVFEGDSVKILVHIRQGDTALLATPWSTFLPLYKLRTRPAVEHRTSADAGADYIRVQDFHSFTKSILEHLSENKTSVLLCSDGFKRAFKKALNIRNIRRFGLSEEQVTRLTAHSLDYDEREFSIFDDLKLSARLIGESEDNLYDLIDSALLADIIVIGTQQRMLPKLIATYYDLKRPKIIVTLYRGAALPEYGNLGLTADKARCLYFNLDTDNASAFAARLKGLLSC